MSGENKKVGRGRALRILNVALIVLVAVLLAFVLIRIFFVTTVSVNQTSMSPTYADGETVFVGRLGSVERGAVVVYFDSDVATPRLASAFGWFAGDAKLLIKRAVAVAGDRIWLERTDGGYKLIISYGEGEEARITEEEYTHDGAAVALDPITFDPDTAGVLKRATRWDPYIVSEGCAFMMGDNRSVSVDSRITGDVPLSRVIGVVM